ncbi:MAG TPA: chemotaxis protein CheW [Methylomirabilota bacterium]|nr:chemotaxis protein CheW [Methylomirabilota bacterium]
MLRRRSTQPDPLRRQNVVLFGLEGHRFALPARDIVEVARIESYTPLPCEDPAHLGVVLHREHVIPLVDVGPRLGLRRPRPAVRPRLCVFVRAAAGELGLPVDEVLGFRHGPGEAPREEVLLDPDGLGGSYGQGTAH